MKGKFARVIAAAVAGSVLAMTGAGVAAADTSTAGAEVAGQQVLQLRDQLTRSAYSADVQGTEHALAQLNPALGDLAVSHQYSARADVQQQAGQAQSLATESSRVLADPSQAATARQLPVPSLPDLPPPLNIVSDLLKSLLAAVSNLLATLAGTLPVPPLPVPVPVPSV